MKKWVIIVTAVLSWGMLLASGCRHAHNKGEQLDIVFDYLEEALDLDKAQQVKLAEIKKEWTEKLAVFKESREKMHPIFKEQLASAQIDKAVIKQAISAHRRQLDEAIDLAVDHLAEFHALLTPAQRQKLLGKLEKIEKWHGCGGKQ